MSDQIEHSLLSNQPAKKMKFGWLKLIAVLTAILAALPLLGIASKAVGDSSDVWPHLLQYVLPQSASTTLILLSGVGILVFIFGTTTAWLVSRYDFPLKRILEWALVLPLATPTYISAYIYVEFLDFTGPVQTLIRDLFGFQSARDYWFPDIRSTGGAILLLSLVLFPYVYLPARLAFQMQSSNILDVGRMLGANSIKLFTKVAIPSARPAIAIGVILALMETLNDIGAVEYLGVRTITLSVYETWLNRSSLAGAAQISISLLAVIVLLVFIERKMRSAKSFQDAKSGAVFSAPVKLDGWRAHLSFLWCFVPVLFGFLIPVIQIALLSVQNIKDQLNPRIFDATINSAVIALITAVICIIVAFLIIQSARNQTSKNLKLVKSVASFGYAVPGTILALGVLGIIGVLDSAFSWASMNLFDAPDGLILSGSLIVLVYAYTVRFLTIAIGTIEAGYEKISMNLANAARTLGRTEQQALFQVEIPLLKKAFLTAGLLVCVDAIKELPATLLLRPFNFNSLATFVYEHASRAAFDDAAFAALIIVIAGLIPVYILTRVIVSGQS